MKVELCSVPAIHLGGACVVPQRKTWDVFATQAELEALTRAAEALAECPERFPLDSEAIRTLTFAIEVVQVVARLAEPP